MIDLISLLKLSSIIQNKTENKKPYWINMVFDLKLSRVVNLKGPILVDFNSIRNNVKVKTICTVKLIYRDIQG